MWSATPILGVRDVAATVEHFVAVLGFERVATFGIDDDGAPAYGIVAREQMAIHMQVRLAEPSADRPDIETDAYINVDDVDALYEEYQAGEVTMFRGIYDNDYGMRDFCIATPSGLRIAFGSPLS